MLEFISKVNWVDISIIILILRICYVSWHLGVGKQILPLIFLIFILVISFHYYARLALSWAGIFGIAESVSNFISFLLLVIIPSIIVKYINRFWMNVTGGEGQLPLFERVGGIILGFVRANIVIGFVIVALLLTPVSAIENSVKKGSLLSSFFINANANIYCTIINMLPRQQKRNATSVSKKLMEKKDCVIKLFDWKAKSGFGEGEKL